MWERAGSRLSTGAVASQLAPTEQIKQLVATDTTRAGAWTRPGVARPGESLWEFFHHRDDRLVGAQGRTIVPVLVFDRQILKGVEELPVSGREPAR